MATLDFKGKALVQNYHLSVKYHELVPKKDKSLTDKVRLDDNLIIHGDNLKALKALLPTYAGRVKCIYIDPPYNTGNEGWAYNDNVNSPMMQEWLGKAVDREDLTRHDKWLCMMLPRLKLLRELLRDDGTIFISIDDNEQHRLRMLLDEVFGEENFISVIVVQSNKRGQKLPRLTNTFWFIPEVLTLNCWNLKKRPMRCLTPTRRVHSICGNSETEIRNLDVTTVQTSITRFTSRQTRKMKIKTRWFR